LAAHRPAFKAPLGGPRFAPSLALGFRPGVPPPFRLGDIHRRAKEQDMSVTTDPTCGARVELGRYETPEGERVLVGRRIEGEVFVYDHPVGQGRPYFVERGFDSKAELAILLADYRRRAAELGGCPMSAEAIRCGLGLAAA
jgi:hypothetical protein